MNAPIRVLCVDDHPLVLTGLETRLEAEPDFTYVGGLPSAEHVLIEAERTRADIVLMDVALPGRDPFAVAKELGSKLPEARVVFLSAYLRDSYLHAAYEAGAWGYLFKGDDLDEVVAGLRQVAQGEFGLSPSTLDRVARAKSDGVAQSRLQTLSPTEVRVLRLIGKGLGRGEIARLLHRSPKTVDTHRENLMRKLGIHDRVQLALFAVREGLVNP